MRRFVNLMRRFGKLKQGSGKWKGPISLYPVALLLVLPVLLLSLYPPPLIQSLASAISDGQYRLNPRVPPQQLVFLEIENTSVQAFGRWPWPRSVLAEGLTRLHLAEVVALDMVFSEATRPEEDRQLAEALVDLPVVGGVFLNGPLAATLQPHEWELLLYSALLDVTDATLLASDRLELPTPQLRGALPLLAALNIQPDADQQLRHYPLAFALQDMALPNLGVQLWRLGRQQDFTLRGSSAMTAGQSVPVDAQQRSRLNFYPPDTWQRIRFAELMQDDWDPERLAGRWVMVGVSEAGVTDLRATPLGYQPGPLVHLTFVANLLDASLLQEVQGIQLAVVLLLTLLTVFMIWQLASPWLRLQCYGVIALLLVATGAGLYLWLHLWLEIFYPLLLLLLLLLLGEVWLFVQNRAETAWLRNAFSSYVAPALVDRLVNQPQLISLGGQRQQLTVVFTDLRDFTPTTEALGTEELVRHLNAYFGQMIEPLHRYQGTLDKLIGDAIMALFNAPLPDENHALHACLSAAAMLQALERFNADFPDDPVRQLRMGIGINTGEGVVGNIGAAGRFNYTAIGDVVNVAARLESATKAVNDAWQQARAAGDLKPCETVDILMGEATWLAVRDQLPCYPAGALQLKGKSMALQAWVLDWRAMQKMGLLS